MTHLDRPNKGRIFNILDHLDRLTSDGGNHGKNEQSFHCPVCNASNFKVMISGPNEGKYSAYGCDCMATNSGKQRVIDAISPRWEKPNRPKSSKIYTYETLENLTPVPTVQVRRSDDGKGKRNITQWHQQDGLWVPGLPSEMRSKIHLYRIFDEINQTAIADGEPIFIVEGEGNVNDLIELGIAATCSIGGASGWNSYGHANYVSDLSGAVPVICPDRDVPGLKYGDRIADDFPGALWVYADPTAFQWGRSLPENGGFDIGDWISDGATKEQILGAIEPRRVSPEVTTLPPGDEAPSHKRDTRPQADQLLDLVLSSNISLFITPDEVAYADLQDGATRRTLPLRRKSFRQWLKHQFYQANGRSASSDAVQQAIDTLEAKSVFTGEKRETHLRVATHEERVYVDLGSETWETVEISRDGWRVVRDAPVRFRRHDGMLPMPIPTGGGKVEDLKDLLHLSDDSWIMVLCFILQCLKPSAEYPIMIFHGPPGAGKSSISEALKSIIDPATAPLVHEVGDARNFSVAALNRHLIAIDNLSGLTKAQSDLLCTTSTGGGYTHRTLHSDAEETTFSYCRPLILNGIESVATMGDLLRRSFLVSLERPEVRISRSKFKKAVEDMKPSIFGALCDLLSKVLAVLPEIEGTYSSNDESFVEFVEIGLAAERVMNWEPGTVLRVLAKVRDEAHETAIEASPVGQAIQSFMKYRGEWSGTMNSLLGALREEVGPSVWQSKGTFPQNAIHLSKQLTRLSLDLKALGVSYEKEATRVGKIVSLKSCKSSSPSSPSSQTAQNTIFNRGFECDDKCDDSAILSSHSSRLSSHLTTESLGCDDRIESGDDKKKTIVTPKPAPTKGGDDGDDGDDKKAIQSSPLFRKDEVWKYWDEVGTFVQVLKFSHDKARIRVPGETRDRWVDEIELRSQA